MDSARHLILRPWIYSGEVRGECRYDNLNNNIYVHLPDTEHLSADIHPWFWSTSFCSPTSLCISLFKGVGIVIL